MAAASTSRRSGSAGPCALVVEDDGLLAMEIEEALRESGIADIAVCGDVASAMARLDERIPDILVLDVHLVDRDDGWTLAELVQELSPVPPCIIFSTGMPESIPARVAHLGTVLVKPYSSDALIRAIGPRRRGMLARLRDVIAGT